LKFREKRLTAAGETYTEVEDGGEKQRRRARRLAELDIVPASSIDKD
jgi:hypothetical protein